MYSLKDQKLGKESNSYRLILVPIFSRFPMKADRGGIHSSWRKSPASRSLVTALNAYKYLIHVFFITALHKIIMYYE